MLSRAEQHHHVALRCGAALAATGSVSEAGAGLQRPHERFL